MPASIYGPGTRSLHVNRRHPGGRRYYLPNGAVIVVNTAGSCTLLPAFCHRIDVSVSRERCAEALRNARSTLRSAA
jgi:hypothetical protein